MKDNVKKIFRRNIVALGLIDSMVHSFRIQNYDASMREASTVMYHLNLIMQDLTQALEFFQGDYSPDISMVTNILQGILIAQESKDYELLADLYEMQMTPFLYQIQEYIISHESEAVDLDLYQTNRKALEDNYEDIYKKLIEHEKSFHDLSENYHIEYTSCGLRTLSIRNGNIFRYLHSNRNGLSEASALANNWYDENKTEYIVYGLGMGYHIQALINIDTSLKIKVFESDIHVIQMACAGTDLYQLINNKNIKIYYDPDFRKLKQCLEKANDHTQFVIHHPSLFNVRNLEMREKLEAYFIQFSSIKNQEKIMSSNFNINIQNYDSVIDVLKDKFKDKNLYIVAAGPSLDKNLMMLKDLGKDSIILATSTVFKKMLRNGIKPHYVIATDANSRVYQKIEGYENSEIPMLLLSTACKHFSLNYKGTKYLILQEDYSKAEEMADKNGTMLFQTGGSVSTTALDIGIKFGCKRIIFLGLDLAFTDNYVHASDTSQRNLADTSDLLQVEDIHGNLIYTSRSLNMYRIWIEKRIHGVSGIEFIDATEGGAKINGMKVIKLSECMKLS